MHGEYQANIKQAQDGYSHIDSTMWDENGKAIVMSHQTVSVFG
jgi:acyl-CoA thioesterase